MEIDMEEINENHFLVVVIQLLIFLLAFAGCFLLMTEIDPELKSKETYLASICYNLSSSDKAEEKLSAQQIVFGTNNEEAVVMTKKTLDLESGELWLNERQQQMLMIYMLAGMLTALVYVVSGIGKFYHAVRHVIAEIFAVSVALFFVTIPVAVAIAGFVITVLGLALPVMLPVALLVHVGCGAIGIMRDRNPAAQAAAKKKHADKFANLVEIDTSKSTWERMKSLINK